MSAGVFFERLFHDFIFPDNKLVVDDESKFMDKLQFWFSWVVLYSEATNSTDVRFALEVSIGMLAYSLMKQKDTMTKYIECMRILLISVLSFPKLLHLDLSSDEFILASQRMSFPLSNELEDCISTCSQNRPWIIDMLMDEIPFLDCFHDVERLGVAFTESVYFKNQQSTFAVTSMAWMLCKLASLPIDLYTSVLQRCLYASSWKLLEKFVEMYLEDWFINQTMESFHLPVLYLLTCPSLSFVEESSARKPLTFAYRRMYLANLMFEKYLQKLTSSPSTSCCGLQVGTPKPFALPDICQKGNLESWDEWVVVHMWVPNTRIAGYSFHIPKKDFDEYHGSELLYQTSSFCMLNTKVRCRSLPMVMTTGISVLRKIYTEELVLACVKEHFDMANEPKKKKATVPALDFDDSETKSITDEVYDEDRFVVTT